MSDFDHDAVSSQGNNWPPPDDDYRRRLAAQRAAAAQWPPKTAAAGVGSAGGVGGATRSGPERESRAITAARSKAEAEAIGNAGQGLIEKYLPYVVGIAAAATVFWVGTRGSDSSDSATQDAVAEASAPDDVVLDVRSELGDEDGVRVSGSGGDIQLSGEVASAEDRSRVLAAADRVPGVDRVTDRLVVVDDGASTAGSSDVAADVRAALTEAGLTGTTAEGSGDPIVLSGTVPTAEQRDRAARVALDVPGVDSVVNGIVVPDAGIAAAPEPTLPADPAALPIDSVVPPVASGTETAAPNDSLAPTETTAPIEGAAPADTVAAVDTAPPGTDTPAAVPADPAVAVLSADEMDAWLDARLAANPVNFATSDGALLPESFATLNDVAAFVNASPAGTVFEIAGHTDSRGTDEANLALSEARAKTVLDYLVSLGVPAERLRSVGFGENAPISNDRALNRRVEVTVVR